MEAHHLNRERKFLAISVANEYRCKISDIFYGEMGNLKEHIELKHMVRLSTLNTKNGGDQKIKM